MNPLLKIRRPGVRLGTPLFIVADSMLIVPIVQANGTLIDAVDNPFPRVDSTTLANNLRLNKQGALANEPIEGGSFAIQNVSWGDPRLGPASYWCLQIDLSPTEAAGPPANLLVIQDNNGITDAEGFTLQSGTSGILPVE